MSEPLQQFGADYWEARYRDGEATSRLEPSPSLVTAADGVAPGTALDAGCGAGADTLWLAARGWRVTAVDVSPTALDRGRRTASAAGPALAERVVWVQADVTTWDSGPRGFDLVSSHYVHVPGPPEALFRRLASWVAAGGTLVVVGHDGAHGHGDHHPPESRVVVDQVLSVLPAEAWDVVTAGSRTRTVRRPDGDLTLDDVVVHARRRAS